MRTLIEKGFAILHNGFTPREKGRALPVLRRIEGRSVATKGFTLLELMVVIGIIALLIAAATTSYGTVQKKSRDARRKTDLKNIQDALEQYYSVCGFVYPTPAAGKVPSAVFCPAPTMAFITTPQDPSTKVSYSMTGGGASYSICAPNTPPLETETTASFCLVNQQ